MPRTKLACDACRQRKVRCNGEQRCQQCTHLGLKCQYDPFISDSKSRKIRPRGHVIDALRAEARPASNINLAPYVQEHRTTLSNPQQDGTKATTNHFEELAQDYETYVFPFIPIITKKEYLKAVAELEHDHEAAALVYALGAMTLNMRSCPDQSYESTRIAVMTLTTKAIESRGPILPQNNVTIQTAMVSAMASTCMLAHHANHDIAFFYLREAIALAEILTTANKKQSSSIDTDKSRQLDRLYWLLFVHERFVAISLFRQPILPHPIEMIATIQPEENLSTGISVWFTCIIRLFSTLDQTFIENWIDKGTSSILDLGWIRGREAHLNQVMHLLQQHNHVLTDMQYIDLITTDLWLRTLLWKLALTNFLLTSNNSVDPMSIFFPLQLSRKLQTILTRTPQSAFEVHGSGMLEKIFDVANTFADILAYMPTSIDVSDRLSDFHFLRDYLNSMSRFGNAERAILIEKSGILQAKLQ